MQDIFEKIIEKLEERTSFLSDCTKYGNNNAKQQNKSYSTIMMYEVADLVDDLIEIVKQEAEKFGTDTNVGSNGWIPCSSGVMPKECITKDGYMDPSEEVLVYIYYGENCVNNGCGVSRYWEHTKFHKNPWIDLKYGKENVVAWQPLPLPFRDKE